MNRTLKKGRALLVALLLLLLITSSRAQPPASTQSSAPQVYSLSIKEAVAFADKNNVQVKNSLLDYQIQEQTNRGITSAAYPQLSGTLGTTYYPNIPVQSFPNFIAQATYGVLTQEGVKNGSGQPIQSPSDFGLITAGFGTKWNASGGVSFSQILFDGQVFVGLQARRTSLDYARSNTEVTRENIKANVYKVYYQLVVSRTQMEQIDANITRADKLLNDTRALFNNGFAQNIDVSRASVQLANFQTQKLTIQRNIDNGYLGLKYLLGVHARDSIILTDQITDEEIREGVPMESSYQYSDRKEFQQLTAADQLNQYNIKRYKYSYLPTANLSSNFSKQAFRNKFDFFSNQPWYSVWSIGLNINIPIFDGFNRASNVAKAKLQQQQTQNQLDYLKLSIDNDVALSRNSFSAAIVTLSTQKKNMELAQEVYEQSKKKYESGLGTSTDITTAQTDLVTAQSNYVNAMYDAIISRIDYLKAIGKLP
ncbi:MAG: TolC family protein [Bacteroidetes bacterium]|nr:TolC family protein [Bacteroidota bacterium]